MTLQPLLKRRNSRSSQWRVWTGVTSQQPRSPSPPPGHGGEEKRREEEEGGGGRGESLEQAAALEAAEQQMILIHDEYKKLLREKEDEIVQLKSVIHQEHGTAQPDVDGQMTRKDLAVHKEMVAELRQQLSGLREQLTDKEKELKELNGRAEGKFSRLKTQAKTKIRELTAQLERMREEQGASPQLNLSATQVLDSSLLSTGGEEDSGASEQLQALQTQLTHTQRELEERKREEEERKRELEERKKELEERKEEEEERKKEEEERKEELEERKEDEEERRKELERVREEKKSLQQQVDSLRDKLNVSEVCVGKEREERVRLELKATELEEELETQASHISSVKQAATQLQKSLTEEQEHSHSLQLQLDQIQSSTTSPPSATNVTPGSQDDMVGSDGVPSKPPVSPGPPDKDDDHPSTFTPVMASGDRGSLVDMEQEISRLETALKQKDEQLSSFKTILEQTQAALDDARERGRNLAGNLENLSSEQSLLTQRVEALSLELTESAGCAGDEQRE
ncbi:hypothetical protein GBAR_LOCUS6522 [Geodia barretti]|uniref:Uncharacterized protein n=1 Tax=Geodia barretti TaxID=519541 RepID=A0AA35RF13_GEOBA|nr:hypothetical protein GBAR_LOCUS6522 [Geodia barretti]